MQIVSRTLSALTALSVIIPIIFFLCNEFTFCQLIVTLKEFSFPSIIVIFSSYWLYYKLKSKKLEQSEELLELMIKNPVHHLDYEVRKSKLIEEQNQFKTIRNSLENLETASAISTLILGIICLISLGVC